MSEGEARKERASDLYILEDVARDIAYIFLPQGLKAYNMACIHYTHLWSQRLRGAAGRGFHDPRRQFPHLVH